MTTTAKLTTETEYVEYWNQQYRDSWFKNHQAKILTQTYAVTVIEWRNPESWNYGCRFIIHSQWLTVVGDIGEAVYQWSDKLTLNFLGGCAFHYFKGKCQASESGKDFQSFESELAAFGIAQWLKDEKQQDDFVPKDYHDTLSDLTEDTCKDDFKSACQEVYDATGDGELAGMLMGFGEVPNVRCIGHFVGLQMAIAQLTAAASVLNTEN